MCLCAYRGENEHWQISKWRERQVQVRLVSCHLFSYIQMCFPPHHLLPLPLCPGASQTTIVMKVIVKESTDLRGKYSVCRDIMNTETDFALQSLNHIALIGFSRVFSGLCDKTQSLIHHILAGPVHPRWLST